MLTRRTATVTTSAPDASMAFWVSTKSLYLPVPTQSRERNSMPAIVNRSSFMLYVLSTTDEPDDFHAVPVAQRRTREGLPVHNCQVQLHGDSFGGNAQVGQERRDRVSIPHLRRGIIGPWSLRAIWRSPPSSTASPTSWNLSTPTPSGSGPTGRRPGSSRASRKMPVSSPVEGS